MKLLRFGETGHEKPGLFDDTGRIRDLSAHIDDVSGNFLSDESISILRKININTLPVVEGHPRIGPCVGGIGKIMCIGLNYADHAAETGAEIPKHPLLFMKATSAVIGPNDTVLLPRGSKTTDWEVELAVVIGKKCKYASKDEALTYVAGYCVANDVSERTFQKHLTGQWTKGKSCDTFGPIGPFLVTRDEVPDPQDLKLGLDLNGKAMQKGTTSFMIFSIAEIIEHLSSLMTLYPGDIISTGTPPGVGAGIKPQPIFLKHGDIMRVYVEGLGEQKLNVKAEK